MTSLPYMTKLGEVVSVKCVIFSRYLFFQNVSTKIHLTQLWLIVFGLQFWSHGFYASRSCASAVVTATHCWRYRLHHKRVAGNQADSTATAQTPSLCSLKVISKVCCSSERNVKKWFCVELSAQHLTRCEVELQSMWNRRLINTQSELCYFCST